MKKIGIIGGMGPMAGVDLMQKIIQSTKASKDQEHIHIFMDSNCEVPDRTAAILGTGPSPVDQLVCSGLNLENMGADVIIMACNTAHYFLPQMQPLLHIPVINMVEETAKNCKKKGIACAGLLATQGTYQSGLYDVEFEKQGLQLLEPSDEQKKVIQDMIYNGVKAGRPDYDTTAFRAVLSDLKEAGAEVFILGCTEVPLAVTMYAVEDDYIDPTQILADCAVAYVGGELVHQA